MYASAAVGAILLAAGAYRLLSGNKAGSVEVDSPAGQQFADSREGVVLNDASSSRDDRNSSLSEYLKVRPPNDDGYLTLGEAKWQWKYGNGEPVMVDAEKLSLPPLKRSGFELVEGMEGLNQAVQPTLRREFVVHGTITARLTPSGTSAMIIPDTFNFDMKPWWPVKNALRNVETMALRFYVGKGQPFPILFRGEVPVVP